MTRKQLLIGAGIAVPLLLIVVVLALSAGGEDETTTTPAAMTTIAPPETTTQATTTTTTTTTTMLPPSPLNGLGVEDAASLDRRVVAVKIDNHPDAQPQSGIQKADAIYELLVEGGLTRFIALFHSSDAEFLGPVRSGRPTDPTLVKPLGAPLQISGAQDWVISLINRDGVKLIGDNGDTTFRIPTRSSPHNLYGSTLLMRQVADARGYPDEPPPPMFDFGEPTPSDTPAVDITLDWSDRPVVRWEWDGTQYLRFNADTPQEWISEAETLGQTGDEEGTTTTTGDELAEPAEPDRAQISTDTLVVLTAERYTARPASGSGTPVPALDTVGEGQALLFYGGVVVQGSWERGSIDDPFRLLLPDGTPMTVPAGRLWVSVFPRSQPLTWE
ncbi:MAG: DUF3048 domain-containing protein [Acidimicrobiia bacterium]